MTYADKYALMKAYKIITGDDPDQNKSPDRVEYAQVDTKISATKVQALEKAISDRNISNDKVIEVLKKFNYKSISDILVVDAKKIWDELTKEEK